MIDSTDSRKGQHQVSVMRWAVVRSGSWVLLFASIPLACGGRTDSPDVDEGSGTGGRTSGGSGAPVAPATTGGVAATTGGTPTLTTGGTPVQASGGMPTTGGVSSSSGGGGATGSGAQGQGGADPGVPRCVPGASAACACASGQLGAQLCNSGGYYDPCQCELVTLDWFRSQLVGNWLGTRRSPWDGAPNVALKLTAEGTWAGTCDGSNPIFYWGETPSSGRYRAVSVNSDPEAFGELSVSFGPDNTQQGSLRHIRFNADQSQLWFEFWATWGGEYGPLEFDLRRQ